MLIRVLAWVDVVCASKLKCRIDNHKVVETKLQDTFTFIE